MRSWEFQTAKWTLGLISSLVLTFDLGSSAGFEKLFEVL